MDLVCNLDATKIIVATEHVDKYGASKIVQQCSLPLTGARCVSTIITDLCVLQIDRVNEGMTLTELAPGVSVDTVREKTDANFSVAAELRRME